MQNDYPVPRQLSCKQDCFYLMIGKNRTSLRIPVYEGELHYFYSNYRDYYYLKKEDMAIHKSVASFVDKEYRENAKASNCYTRKSGQFLPQYNSVMQPEFRKEYKDKISYFEMTDDFCTSDVMLRISLIMLSCLITKARKPQKSCPGHQMASGQDLSTAH